MVPTAGDCLSIPAGGCHYPWESMLVGGHGPSGRVLPLRAGNGASCDHLARRQPARGCCARKRRPCGWAPICPQATYGHPWPLVSAPTGLAACDRPYRSLGRS
ncbi:hypothetical protein BHM03_00049171 [Ensete ventricosum]|nr:hypothetical protein BHM03_00049171 [Ensete ventricosum]